MFSPKRPELIGKIQTRTETNEKITYADKGEIALWEHQDSRYILRGTITINGIKYLVSLKTNGR